MGLPTNPPEAAPAYDDVFADRPVNGYKPSRSTSAYAAVPQDDVELHAHDHTHIDTESSPAGPSSVPETLAQTIAGVLRPRQQPHVHCEHCDVQLEARERRDKEKHCCTMVALTFMTFFAALLFGILGTSSVWGKKHGHD